MNLTFVMLVCFIAMVSGKTTGAAKGTTAEAKATTAAAKATTTAATKAATKKGGATRKAKPTKKKYKDVHLAKNQDDCVNKNGKWIEITLTDEAGTNGLQLDFVKVDDQKSLKTLKTPISKTKRRLSRRDDVVTFKDSFCLDYLGKDFSPCYDIVTSSQGKRLEELSWSVKVAALKKASEEDKKKGGKDKVVEAVKEGAAFDDVKILCGRLFKQLGRFSDRQITKLSENSVVDDNDKYRHQKQGDRMLRTAAKIAQKAEDLNLVSGS